MYDALVFGDYHGISELEYLCEKYGDGIIRNAKMSKKQTKSIHGECCNKIVRQARQKIFTLVFAEVINELERHSDHLSDVLGEFFNELHFNDAWKVKFFTPIHLCDLAGELAIDNATIKKVVNEKGYVPRYELCCGAGEMIFGAFNAMQKAVFNRSSDILAVSNDIDERCVFMTYIQCSLYGIPAIVQ